MLRAPRSSEFKVETLTVLALVTASYAWIWLALFWQAALGPDYSPRRFLTIQSNVAADFVLLLWVLVRVKHLKWVLLIGCFLTALIWLYLWAVNSAV